MEYQIPIIAEMVRQLLDYNPDTGIFIWRKRPISMFSDGKQTAEHNCAIWNGKWSGNKAGVLMESGYIKIVINRKPYRAHRLAWVYIYGVWPKEIDHINGDRADNRIENLRVVTKSQNQMNRKALSRPTASGVKGVTFHSKTGKWRTRIMVGKKMISLGLYATVEEAASVRRKAAEKYHGVFARSA